MKSAKMADYNTALLSATSSGNLNVAGVGKGTAAGGGFFSTFSSTFSNFVGRKSDDGVYPKENGKNETSLIVSETPSTSSVVTASSNAISQRHSGGTAAAKRDSYRRKGKGSKGSSAITSPMSASNWSWRFSGRQSIGEAASALTGKFTTSTTNVAAAVSQQMSLGVTSQNVPGIMIQHGHQHTPGLLCSICEQFKLSTSLRERVIEPKKVPDFLIPTLPLGDRQRMLGRSANNVGFAMGNNISSNNASSNLKGKSGGFLAADSVIASTSFYGGLPSSGTSNELSSERRMSNWRRGSIPSSLDNLIYGTLQTNELIKRSSTELINDLVEIIAPEVTRKQTAPTIEVFGLPSPKATEPPGGSLSAFNSSSNGELLKLSEGRSASAYSSNNFAGQWECYPRCIATVRFQLTERQKHCVLAVFMRRIHNSAASASFYTSLKSSVMQWKLRLIVANKSCSVLVKRKYTINGPMPLEENEMFTGVRLPRLSKLLNNMCSIWLRLQLCHRPIDDYDDDDADDNGLWQRQSRRRHAQQTSASRRTTARTQRFWPFHIFLSSILPPPAEWCSEVECPSVKVSRREKQQQQPPQGNLSNQHPIHNRSFAAFPCSSSSAAAFDKTLLSSSGDKRNMVIGLLSLSFYVFAAPPADYNDTLNVVIDVKDVHWKKPGIILAKFLDFWLFAKTTHCDGREEKSKTGMKTSRLWAKSEVDWRIRTIARRGSVKSVVIRLSGRTINTSVSIANIELSESSEDYVSAQLFHTVFRHVYMDESFNRPAETLSKSLLVIAGDGDENNAGIRHCFTIECVLPLVAVA